MIQIQLSDEECVMLREVLARHLDDLRHEIHHTANREFKALLRKREAFVDRLMAHLQQAGPATS